jgi:endonuclease/exonuclease/phosphatase family metal-dependent hydrolase
MSCLVLFASMAAAAPPLRVVTYNIEYGKEGLAKVVETLRRLDADVVALEEVDRGTSRAGKTDQLRRISGELSMHSAFAGHERMPEGPTGVALLSRWPIVDVKRHVGPGRLAVLEAEVRVPGRPLHVFVVHLFPTDPLESAEKKQRHDDYRLREAQKIERLMSRVAGPLMVLGDFNDDTGSPVYQLFSRKLRDACQGKALDKTWPAGFPLTRIDFVWLSRELEATRCDAVDSRASDHRPVLVELSGSAR